LRLITEFKGALRPRTGKVIKKTGGMTFDIFYEFNEAIGKKQFLAIDVYTRIPANGWAVFAFLNKIKWAKTQTEYGLKGKTFGMIVFRNATPGAIEIAKKHQIRFINLSNLKIDYRDIREQAENKLSASPPLTMEDIEKRLSGIEKPSPHSQQNT
jgi:hypothetical protein